VFETIKPNQQISEIIVCFDEIGFDSNSLLEITDGLFQMIELNERIAKVAVCLSRVWISAKRLANPHNGLIGPSQLEANEAQVVQRIEVVSIKLQNSEIKLLSLRQLTLLLQQESLPEHRGGW
jgi:hypothetical protein